MSSLFFLPEHGVIMGNVHSPCPPLLEKQCIIVWSGNRQLRDGIAVFLTEKGTIETIKRFYQPDQIWLQHPKDDTLLSSDSPILVTPTPDKLLPLLRQQPNGIYINLLQPCHALQRNYTATAL